jgi:hypothetical protein
MKTRLVTRRRCGECGHLESEHIPNSVCWNDDEVHTEKVRLPVCIECDATCNDEADELCPACFNSGLPA